MPQRALALDPLIHLADEIDAHHATVKQSLQKSLEHAEAAGLKLIEAKARVAPGQWENWVKKHTRVSPRTARLYQQIAHELPRLDEADRKRVAGLGLTGAVEALANLPLKMPAASKAKRKKAVKDIPGLPEKKSALLGAQCEVIERRLARAKRRTQFETDRRIDHAVVSPQTANVLAALRLIIEVGPEVLAQAATLDPDINLEDLSTDLADAAIKQLELGEIQP